MSDLTYAELFAGAGGLSMGLELAGWEAVAHAEIEPHARAVLRKHWPACRLDGDVSQVNGADYAGVTLLSGGSPCQDLSVAGKRAGMTEGSGTRSSLYFEQVRIWQESQAPYFLWENVLGALSSNNGRDFAAVLSALVGAAIAVPSDGWQSAGVAAGPTGVAAWRVLDAQYFGVPQRRRRVFVLGARTGGVDPAEVLAVSEGVRGDTPARGEAGEGTAADARGGAAFPLDARQYRRGDKFTKSGRGGGEFSGAPGVGVGDDGDPSYTLGQVVPGVVAFHPTQDPITDTVSPAIGRTTDGMGVLTYDCRGNGEGVDHNTLAGGQNRVTEYTALVLRQREGKDGGGKGPLLSAERERTLGTGNDQVVFTKQQYGRYEDAPSVDATLGARDHASQNTDLVVGAASVDETLAASDGEKWGSNQWVDEGKAHVGQSGVPRRLMPVECERLMGWPDQWTAVGVDENGADYAMSDTARYRMIGNGVASPVAAWIGFRLRAALEAP